MTMKTMPVGELMVTEIHTCLASQGMGYPARLMWEHDCGCVPVVDTKNQVVGMITDRDICMAGLHQNHSPQNMGTWSAMSSPAITVRADDDVVVAHELMRAHHVRRLPVVDPDGHLVGLLSLSDLARAQPTDEVSETLTALVESRHR